MAVLKKSNAMTPMSIIFVPARVFVIRHCDWRTKLRQIFLAALPRLRLKRWFCNVLKGETSFESSWKHRTNPALLVSWLKDCEVAVRMEPRIDGSWFSAQCPIVFPRTHAGIKRGALLQTSQRGRCVEWYWVTVLINGMPGGYPSASDKWHQRPRVSWRVGSPTIPCSAKC